MKKLLIVVLVALCCGMSAIHAQTVTGVITDETGHPMEYANVVLLGGKDSAFVAGCMANEEGRFSVENMDRKGSLLKLSYIGYEDLYYKLDDMTGDVGTLALKPKSTMLKDVTVTASKPLFRQKNGAMVTNVAGSVLSEVHEMTDLLSQIPGMVRTADGGVQVFGSGSPIIYINNRKVEDLSELSQLSPKDIKSVELITNPGAKYDAEGKAVLKVVTLKKEDGMTLQLSGKAEQNDLTSYDGSIKLGVKHRGLNTSVNYVYNKLRSQSVQPQIQELFLGEDNHRYVQDQTSEGDQNYHKLQLSMDYEINDAHSIGIEWNTSYKKAVDNRLSTLGYEKNGTPVENIDIRDDYQNKTNYNHVNLFHNGNWGENLSTEFNLDFVGNSNSYHQSAEEKSAGTPSLTVSNGDSHLDIYAGKLAFNYKLNEKIGLSWGMEYNHIDGSGTLSCVPKRTPSSDYNNTEDKYALYAEMSLKLGQVSVSGGVRYEDLTSDYKDNIDNDGDVHRHYRNLYPSLSVSHNSNGGWYNTLSFSSRTSRPTFRQLSNSNYYLNEFMYQCGNPLLKPSVSYVAQWNTGYKFVNFSASYTYVKNHISTDFYNTGENQNQIVCSYINHDHIEFLKANVNIQKTIAWWEPSLTIGVSQPFFRFEYLNENLSYNRAQFYVVANQYFRLPGSCLLSVYYYYNSGGDQEAVRLKSYQMLNVSIQKKFLSDRLSVRLQAYDIFHGMKFREDEKIRNIHFRQTEDYNLWNYSVSIVYRLNQLKTKYRGKTSIDKEIQRL